MSDRATARRILAVLRRTAIGDEAVLVGSSGLFGFETAVPALTEDIDLAIPEAIAAANGEEVVSALIAEGFEHEAGTATFTRGDGTTFDLLGVGDVAAGDHIAGVGALRVMVFEDLSRIVAEQRAVLRLPEGGRALSPAGFVASKLLTERGHKGAKDKLQALLVIAERAGEPGFEAELRRLLGGVEPIRRDDARAAAQEACLSLGRDRSFADAGAEGYGVLLAQVERGFERLGVWLDAWEGGRG